MPPKILRHPAGGDASLLSPSNYDDDAPSVHSSRSEDDSDSEDDEVLNRARTSADIRRYDQSVLLEEEERDKLLEDNRRSAQDANGTAGGLEGLRSGIKGLWSKSHQRLPGIEDNDSAHQEDVVDTGEKGRQRRIRRQRRKEKLMEDASHGEDGELMYEMEQGRIKEGSATGSSSDTDESDDLDRRGLLNVHDENKQRRKRRWAWCAIYLLIVLGFMALLLVAWKLSQKARLTKENQKFLSNGTALFAPTTILISLDGFRADFLNRGLTPRLNAFVKEGISPVYMMPSFPSVTFPNHYTLVTGLYPESHGIVGNTFWDVELQEEFYYTHPSAMHKKWWGGEPLWVTAENQGIRTAIHMWPGSEAHIMDVEPAYLDQYNGKEPLSNKVDRVLELLDKPGQEDDKVAVEDMRPQLIAAYVPNVDADGHLYGPNSTEIRVTISDVDTMLDNLFRGLETRNLTNIVNVVVVSDHGMATTDTARLIQLEDLIDTSLIEHTDGWPLFGLRPKDPTHLQALYDGLAAKAATNPNIEVYLRDANMPERYHFSTNERIAPLWIVPKTGWAIVKKDELDVVDAKAKGIAYHPRGLHGYDHEHPLMRAIFIARGPAFPHEPNSRVEPFQNIEVYNIICDSLALTPKPNNGTLRLPLKSVGVHSDETSPPEPADPEPTPSLSDAAPDAILSISPIEASSAADPNVVPPHMVGVDTPDNPVGDDTNVDRPVVEDESGMTEEEKNWWEWFKGELDDLKGWIGGFVQSGGKNETQAGR
ncbi:type I phosphodiesterase nucleotide pyrophosphatase protein [Rutstroemia sp. NJR-2017a WRK4]|nr:type I phosphodiesterase nucleotide pyrophosphatase protein [Rutstroemia sp. NJR-2017a WRK4]